MRKVQNIFIAAVMALGVLPLTAETAEAKNEYKEYYPTACEAYEVDIVNDNAEFVKQECYTDFASAKTKMAELGADAVVRHPSSYSPSKIIAMSEGVAYSYPQRSASVILGIRQYGDYGSNNKFRKSTYISAHHELLYKGTESYSEVDGTGNVHAVVSGFDGIVSLKDIDLVPAKFLTANRQIYLGGNDASGANKSPFAVRLRQSYYSVAKNGNYTDLVYHEYSGWAANGSYSNAVIEAPVGPAASWMNVGDTYYSTNDYTFYTDRNCTNAVGTYYNYYQFLPVRSKSSFPASAYNSFLATNGYGENSKMWNAAQYFIDSENNYGINAFLSFLQGALESKYGTSSYAVHRNNLFGWNAVDSNPDQAGYYNSIKEGVEIHAYNHLSGYANTNSTNFFGAHFGNKESGIAVKYASAPYYGLTIASMAYAFDKLYNNNNGALTAYNEHKIGVVNKYGASVYGSDKKTVLYTTEYGSTYQQQHTVVILGEENGWYKIQSTNNLNADSNTYDWNANVGWIPASDVNVFNFTSKTPVTTTDTSIGTVYVHVNDLRIRSEASTDSAQVGMTNANQSYTVYETKSNQGYTWYRVGINKWIAGKDGWVTFKSNSSASDNTGNTDNKPAEEVNESEDTKYTEETANKNDDLNLDIMSSVKKLEWKDQENQILHVEGMAYILGMDATDVTHEVVLVNMKTNTEIVIPATTFKWDQEINEYDGHTYANVGYSADIDLKQISDTNYYLKVRVKNQDKQSSRSLFTNRISALESVRNGSKTLRVFPNSLYRNRFEVSNEIEGVDYTLINKPTSKFSTRTVKNLSVNDGVLSFNGYGYIYNASMTEADHPVYKLLLVDENGTKYTYDAATNACEIDYSSDFGLRYSISNSCYSFKASLADLPAGTYRMYLDIKNDSYEDIEELYNFRQKDEVVGEANGKKYSIQTTSVHARYELTITQ